MYTSHGHSLPLSNQVRELLSGAAASNESTVSRTPGDCLIITRRVREEVSAASFIVLDNLRLDIRLDSLDVGERLLLDDLRLGLVLDDLDIRGGVLLDLLNTSFVVLDVGGADLDGGDRLGLVLDTSMSEEDSFLICLAWGRRRLRRCSSS